MPKQITAAAIFGAVIGALVIVLAFQVDVPRTPNPTGAPPSPEQVSPLPSSPWIPLPAPLPQPPFPEPGEPGVVHEQPSEPISPPTSPPTIPQPPPTVAPPPSAAELLPLPAVTDNELAISASGASTFSSYLEAFVQRGGELEFDGTKLDALPQNAGGFPLLVADLIEAAIRTGNFGGVRAPLGIHEELLTAKVAWERTIPVRESAVAASKTIIAVDRLTLDLIERAYAVADGTLTRRAFEEHYEQYQATLDFYRKQFRSAGGVSYESPGRELSGLTKLLRVFGLSPEVARAVAAPFGGFITFTRSCSCIGGYALYLTPGYVPAPLTPAVLFLSYAVAATPAIFLNHAPVVGHWILGSYAPTPHPCLHDPPDCDPAGLPAIGNIITAGTS